MTREKLKTIIKEEVIRSIRKFIANYKKDDTPKQPLDYLIKKERRIRSIVGGIETSMGSTLWEPLAKKIAVLNGFEVVNKKLRKPKHDLLSVTNKIGSLLNDRKVKGQTLYDATSTRNEIQKECQRFISSKIEQFVSLKSGKGVDIWLKRDNINYLYDTKTVKPNIEKFESLLDQLISWYGYFYMEFPDQQVECRIVFPYNPFDKSNFWKKSMGGGFPLEPNKEAVVGNEFWDFISGHENTLELIIDAFKEIETTGDLSEDFTRLFG